MKQIRALVLCAITAVLLCCLLPGNAQAVDFGSYNGFYYTISNGQVTITDCDTTVTGDVVIPDTIKGYPVTGISSQAFWQNRGMTAVTIPETVTTIGSQAFYGCSITELVIPASVKEIGDEAFKNCTNLTYITFHDGIETIGKNAFVYCNIYTVTYCGSLSQWEQISIGTVDKLTASLKCHDTNKEACPVCGLILGACGENLSWSLDAQGLLTISGTGQMDSQIPWTDYRDQIRNVVVEDGVTSVAANAFANCMRLKTVKIPDSVTHIGSGIVGYCQYLSELTVPFIGESRKTANDTYQYPLGYFFGTSWMSGYDHVTQYYYGSSLSKKTSTTYAIPLYLEKVTVTDADILSGAFDSCRMESVVFGQGVTSIAPDMFSGCSQLVSVQLSEGLLTIGDNAFYNCSSLQDVTIPSTVTYIGREAFYGTAIASVTIPGGVETIPYQAFENCRKLHTVVLCPGVKTVGGEAFEYANALTTLVLPDTLERIEAYAFEYSTSLTDVVIPDRVSYLGYAAFAHCDVLETVTIGSGMQQIGESAFYNCPALKTVNYCGTDEQWAEINISYRNEQLTGANRVYHSFENGVCAVCGGMENCNVTLTSDTVADWIITADLYVDLCGFRLTGTVKTNGFKVYGMDSATDDYTCTAMGYFNCLDEQGRELVPDNCAKSGKRYMTIAHNGGYTFHRFYFGITHMSLKPAAAGVGYKALFCGDEMVAAHVESLGFTLRLDGNDPITVSKAGDDLVSGKTISLRVDRFNVDRYGETPLYAAAMLKTKTGAVLEAPECSMTLRGLVERLNENHTALTSGQRNAVADMIKKYEIMTAWKVENLVTE